MAMVFGMETLIGKIFVVIVMLTPCASQECPSSDWEEFQGSCFLFGASERVPFSTAKKRCLNNGGYLATISNQEENNFVADKMQNRMHRRFIFLQHAREFYIGLKEDSAGEYQWIDREPVNYTNWSPDEPNDYGGNEQCVTVYTSSGLWNDLTCYHQIPYVCKAKKVSQNVWEPFGEYEYLFSRRLNQMKLDWHAANRQCLEYGANLVSIHSKEEENFIIGQFITHGYDGSYWLGLNMLDMAPAFSWSDKSELNYTNWGDTQPKLNMIKGQLCGYSYIEDDVWNNAHCAEEKAMVCKRKIGQNGTIQIPVTTPVSGYCPKGFVGLPGLNKCFKVVAGLGKDAVTWDEAAERCKKEEGFSPGLATIRNINESALVISQMQNIPLACWLGLYQVLNDPVPWRWIDNQPLDWTNWAPNEPNNAHENCAQMWLKPIGTWNDAECKLKMGYVCQTFKDPEEVIATPPPTSDNICGNGWVSYWNGCYKLVTSPELNWEDAEEACRKQGGHLASVVHESEHAFLQLITRNMYEQYWIGYKKNQTSNLWGWVDGWHTFTTHWGAQEDSQILSGSCAASTPTGQWSNMNCTSKLPYMCKINNIAPWTASPHTEGNCPDSWDPYGDKCYKLVESPNSWAGALVKCQKMGAVLASVHNEVLNDVIRKNYNVQYIWIGLYRSIRDGHWMWSDGSPVEFVKWAPDTMENESQGCTSVMVMHHHIHKWAGYWKPKQCSTSYPFICQRSKDPLPTKPPKVEGKCPGEEWDDYGHKCYLYRPDDLCTWEMASAECELWGGHLAMPQSQEEQAHIFMKQRTLTHRPMLSPFWLGMRKMENELFYTWSDGSIPTWTHWSPNDFDGIGKSDSCVLATSIDGTWNTSTCYDKLNGFVCQTNKTLVITAEELPFKTNKTKDGSNINRIGIILGFLFCVLLIVVLGFLYLRQQNCKLFASNCLRRLKNTDDTKIQFSKFDED